MRSFYISTLSLFISLPLTTQASSAFYQDILPAVLCDEGSYFRECFAMTKSKCLVEIKTTGEGCFNQLEVEISKLKKNINDPEKLRSSARIKMGTCIGQNIEKKLSSKKITSAQCSSEKGW